MADQNITLEESLANQMSSTETVSLQSLPIKDKDITLEEEESLADQMSKVSSLAITSLQSLTLPLLPPCFNYPELLFLIRRQRKASLGMEDKTMVLLLLTELTCHGLARPDFFTLLKTNSLKARFSLLQLLADEWNWLLWSRMNTISSRKPSKEVAAVLHSVLSRCLAVLPADCTFRMGNSVGQFFHMYELKPLLTNVEGSGIKTQETPLIHKFLVRQPVKKGAAADPDYHPDSMTDAESDSDSCSDVALSQDERVKVEGAKVCEIPSKPCSDKSLVSKEGKSYIERENAWQTMGFAVSEKPSACLECWGCWRNKQCYEVAKWERKQAAILKDQSLPSSFLARARASAIIASRKSEESLSEDSLPSPTEKEAASHGTLPRVGSFSAASFSGTSSANPSSPSPNSSPAKSRASSPTVGFWKKFCPPASSLGSPHPGTSSKGCSLPRSSPPGSSPTGDSPSGGSLPGSSLPGSSSPGSSLPGSSRPRSSLPQSSLPQSSLPQSSLPQSSLPEIAPARFSPLNQENVPMRNNLLKDTAITYHKTVGFSCEERRTEVLSCSSTKANPLVEISNNRKRRQPLDFSSAFANKEWARRVDEVDLPCTCDDCRFVTAPHVGRMLAKGIVCRCHPCKLARDKKAGDDLKV